MGYVPTISVRVSPTLKRRIEEAVKREEVSQNAWMVSAAEARLSTNMRRADAKRLEVLEREVAAVKRVLRMG